MLNNKMTKIMTEDMEYPLICTFNVLEYIQNKYGTIADFEQRVSGVVQKEKSGSDKPQYTYTPINIAAMLDGMTAMINEGIKIKHEKTGFLDEEQVLIGQKDTGRILRSAGISLADAANIVLEELVDCIVPKNAETARRKDEMKKEQYSTSRGSSMWERLFSIIRKKK